ALAWAFARRGHAVVAAPGNPGTARIGRNLAVKADDIAGQVRAARDERPDLVVVGPEAPLCAGLADALRAAGIPTFGPNRDGARLEGSKAWSKAFFARHGLPTARFFDATTMAEVDHALDALGAAVVKADGLAAGKGVVVARTRDEARAAAAGMIEGGAFGDAGRRVVIEERLPGREASILAISDGRSFVLLPAAEDHKAVFDGDRGPNTGGLGRGAPPPVGSAGPRRRCASGWCAASPPRASTTAACCTPASWSRPTERPTCSSSTAASATPRWRRSPSAGPTIRRRGWPARPRAGSPRASRSSPRARRRAWSWRREGTRARRGAATASPGLPRPRRWATSWCSTQARAPPTAAS